MNLGSIKDRAVLIGLAIPVVAIVAGFIIAFSQGSRQDFQAGADNSTAYQNINVTSDSIWDVQIQISYADAQKQQYLDQVSRRILSTGPAESWRPVQHLALSLTVAKLDGATSTLIRSETIASEPLVNGGNHAGFLQVAELHLDPGQYLVSIRTLKGDPALKQFEARLLVTRRWS